MVDDQYIHLTTKLSEAGPSGQIVLDILKLYPPSTKLFQDLEVSLIDWNITIIEVALMDLNFLSL